MTADEVVFAGGTGTYTAAWYHYNSVRGKSSTGSKSWWLLSPSYWNGGEYSYASVFNVRDYGQLYDYEVDTRYMGVRPALSLKSCVKYSSGDGTADNPYTIKETASGC